MKSQNENIINQAVKIFKRATGMAAVFKPGADAGDTCRGGLLKIMHGKHEWCFKASVRRSLTGSGLLSFILDEPAAGKEKRILIAEYVAPKLIDTLRKGNIAFLDCAGNMYINEPPLYIFVKGEKPPRAIKPDTIRLFKPSGMKVIFALLSNPGMEQKPMRELAEFAGVAVGTIAWIMKDLQKSGFMVKLGKRGRRLIRKTELLKRWVSAYPEQLKPSRHIGFYSATGPAWWKQADLAETGGFWSGEVAAHTLTRYLKPERIVVYMNQPPGGLLLKSRLRKDPNGKIEILNGFWNFDYPLRQKGIVPPILVYADLMALIDQRNMETAEIIYEREIAGLVREG